MRILLTGYSGFVGKNIIRRLGNIHQIMNCPKKDGSHIIDFNPEVILSVGGEIYNTERMYQANVQSIHDLLMTTLSIPYKAFIHVGSSSEYGRKTTPIRETNYLSPSTWYEGTKAAGSMLCVAFAHEFNKPIIVVRPFSLYGPDDNPKKLIPTLIKAAQTDHNIKLCLATHDYVHIDDFIDGIVLLIEKGFDYGDVVNFGSGIQYTNKEIAEIIERRLNIKFNVETIQPKVYDSMQWSCNTMYAINKYGWRTTTDIETGLSTLCSFIFQFNSSS